MGSPKFVLWIFGGIGSVVGIATLTKDLLGGPLLDKKLKAHGKVAIVTGANTGIGKETVKSLADRGARVYMACRDMEKCEEVRQTIVLGTNNKYVYCRPLDLASFKSIHQFVEIFKHEQERLDILVNNAGVMRCPKSQTAEGIEMQLGVNHMGHFLLTNLLLDMLKKSEPSRIVVVSSAAHASGTINKEDLNSDKSYDPKVAYSQSKLANLLFVNELSTRLLGTKVTVNGLHPGVVDTDIVRHLPVATSWGGYFLKPLAWTFIKTPMHGAQTSLYLALEPSIEGVSGKYFSNSEEIEPSEAAKDVELARWLWAVSEKWTRLNTIQ